MAPAQAKQTPNYGLCSPRTSLSVYFSYSTRQEPSRSGVRATCTCPVLLEFTLCIPTLFGLPELSRPSVATFSSLDSQETMGEEPERADLPPGGQSGLHAYWRLVENIPGQRWEGAHCGKVSRVTFTLKRSHVWAVWYKPWCFLEQYFSQGYCCCGKTKKRLGEERVHLAQLPHHCSSLQKIGQECGAHEGSLFTGLFFIVCSACFL